MSFFAAIWTYTDANLLRQGGAKLTPFVWAVLVFLVWPISLPGYLFLRFVVWQKQLRPNAEASASGWGSVGIGLLCLPFAFAVIFSVYDEAFPVEESYGTVVKFGNDEIYFTGDATEEDAQKLARVLQEIQFFGSGEASVKIDSSAARYTISFVLADKAWKDSEIVDAFKDIGRSLVKSGFATPLTIKLCNDHFESRETLVIPQ